MEKLKFLRKTFLLCLFVFSSVFLSLLYSSSASAFNFSSTGYSAFDYQNNTTWAKYYTTNVNYTLVYPTNPDYSPAGLSNYSYFFINNVNGGTLSEIGLDLGSSIPANSLSHISMRFSGTAVTHNIYYNYVKPFADSFAILNDHCTVLRTTDAGTNVLPSDIQCEYWFYNSSELNYLRFLTNVGFSDTMDLTITSVDYAVMTSSSGSSTDYTSLLTQILSSQGNIQTLLNNDFNVVVARLEDIIDRLGDSPTAQDIADVLESQSESEQEKYEQQSEDNADDINSDSSAAQGTATTLLSVVGQFISTLTSAQPTNCNLNGNLIPHLPLGNLNLCQNSPPASITVLGSLILIAFVVPLAYHTVKRMLALIGSFQT